MAFLCRSSHSATATAIGLLVDGARLPVYLVTQGEQLTAIWPWVALTSAGVCAGTILGGRALTRIPEMWFGRLLALVLALLGLAMIVRGL